MVRPTHTHTNTNIQSNPQTGPITIHCAAKLSAQCNKACISRNLLVVVAFNVYLRLIKVRMGNKEKSNGNGA